MYNPINGVKSTDASRLRVGMGTLVAIHATADTRQHALVGIDGAFAAIYRVERLMHPTRAGSDLLAIREAACGRPVTIHAWTWDVLMLSRRLHEATQGAFDPCLPESAGRLPDLEFAAPRRVVARAPLQIDLGGIAKGFAIDRAVTALRDSGCRSGLVNAGGDLAVFGDHACSVIIRDAAGCGGAVELRDAALASSEVCGTARPSEHRGYYHGASQRRILSGAVSVSAGSAAVADALTKCLLAEQSGSAALLEAFGARRVLPARRG
jgi:thiamine biosynthesis lipoprotein